jgi:hypothetical protein
MDKTGQENRNDSMGVYWIHQKWLLMKQYFSSFDDNKRKVSGMLQMANVNLDRILYNQKNK